MVKILVSGEFWEFCNYVSSITMFSVTVNLVQTLWLLDFRVTDHDSETTLVLQRVVSELDFLYREETTPIISILKALKNCPSYSAYFLDIYKISFKAWIPIIGIFYARSYSLNFPSRNVDWPENMQDQKKTNGNTLVLLRNYPFIYNTMIYYLLFIYFEKIIWDINFQMNFFPFLNPLMWYL